MFRSLGLFNFLGDVMDQSMSCLTLNTWSLLLF
jgi:hypothetical protein